MTHSLDAKYEIRNTHPMHFPLHSAFVASPLEGYAKQTFVEFQFRLKEFEDIFRFQYPETPHLTLQFWREVMEIEYYQMIPQCKKIADTASSFSLKVEGIGTFGVRGEDRVLYLSIPFSEELAQLKKRCPWPSLEHFTPHITLARVKHPQKFAVHKKKILKILGDVAFDLIVDRIRLYAKIDGKNQTPLQDFPFRA